MRIFCPLVACAFVFFGIRQPVWAAPAWQKVAFFRQVEADPNKEYLLTDRHGPWIIMTQSFSGDEAQEQADELVQELRSKYKLRAYRHEMDFDFSSGELGRHVDQFGQPVKMNYRVKRMHEVAVVVGDFASAEDPDAQRVLKKLRTMQPECLDTQKRAKQGKKQYRTMAYFHDQLSEKLKRGQRPQGPMRHALLAPNPLLPEEYFKPHGIDPLVVKMNEGVKYSLLKCPGKFTCKIATFSGQVTVDQRIIEDIIKNGKKFESRLEQAAANAHEMTLALRAKGYEAYEFHDRYQSLVTVGSFDAVGTPRPDGQIEINPKLHEYMETFSAPKQATIGQANAKIGDPFIVQTKIGKIPCDIQAIPVQVPKRSISRDYERPAISLR